MNAIDHRAPQSRGLEHVRLVDGGQLAAPRARELRRDTHHALDLDDAVAAHVERLGGGALLLAEIDAAGELANHHDVDAPQQLRLDRRGVEHRRVGHDGAKIGEQPEGLAQLQTAPARAAPWRSGRTTRGRPPRRAALRRRAGTARACSRPAAPRPWHRWPRRRSARIRTGTNGRNGPRSARARAHRLGGDFRADAVAGQ